MYRGLWPPILAIVVLLSGACAKVGPDYVRPETKVSQDWLEAGDKRVRRSRRNTGTGGRPSRTPSWTGSSRPPTGKT